MATLTKQSAESINRVETHHQSECEQLPMIQTESLLMKSTEAATRLGISKSTLRRWVTAGKIECVQIERSAVYVAPDALRDFVQKHRMQYQPRNQA
jgi:excisionase family DNA binding protein